MSAPNQSGHLKLEDDTIVYTLPNREAWRVPIADLRVIGEFTNTDGPYADDYFFVFITCDQWFEASFYAEGRDTLLAGLGQRLHHKLQTGLCDSTSLVSRVLWPARLESHPLFDLVPEERSRNIFGRLRQWVLPRVHMHFTDEVKGEFESRQ
ncbi:hypothetical protein ACXR0O_23435 [Verrucomicrobiota bacterium sgz303538]